MKFIHKLSERLTSKNLSIASICFLAFVLGSITTFYRIPPYQLIRDANSAANSLVKRYRFIAANTSEQKMYQRLNNLWFPATEDGSGVIYDTSITDDLVLYSDCETAAYLIDRKGNVIHEWRLPFGEAYPNPDHLIDPVPAEQIYWRRARPLKDGSLIAIYEGINQSPYGGEIVRVDKNSKLLWAVPVSAHHDFKVLGEDRLVFLYHKYESNRIDDYVAIVDLDDGTIEKSISLRIAIDNSPYYSMIDRAPRGDYLHTNSVELVGKEWADECAVGEEGDIFLSHNTITAISLLDLDSEKIKWVLSRSSAVDGLHGPDLFNGCRLAYFDNGGGRDGDEVYSRLLTYDFISHDIETVYQEPAGFFSENRGSQQLLDNGNWLTTESTQGTLFQIDPTGKLVWKFVSPHRTEFSVCVMNQGRAYTRPELPFLAVGGSS